MEHPPLYPRPLPPGFRQLWLETKAGWLRLVAGGQGSPLLLIHGLGGAAEDFYDLAPLLADRFCCLIPDLPGFGFSHKPDASYAIPWFAGVLLEACDQLGLDAPPWLGHSMGGQIVLWLAANQPERVDKVVALCPAGGQERPTAKQVRMLRLLASGDRLRLFHPALARPIAAQIFQEPLCGPSSWPGLPEFAYRARRLWSGPDRPLRERALVRSTREVLACPLLGQVGRVRAPVLLLEGRGDHVTPAWQTRRLWAALPQPKRLASLPGGHMVPYLAAPQLAQQVREFLAPDPGTA